MPKNISLVDIVKNGKILSCTELSRVVCGDSEDKRLSGIS
ncbi:hypothetical protein LBC_16280 [Campylobacter sp. 19-13652]|nr:hypothetical protein LBC_16280 [Campylobacter sp. 19-13652]